MTDKEKQIDEMAKTAIYRAVNGRRCLRSGHCKHCGAHKAVSNPQYEKCDCYRMAEIIFDAGYRKQVEGEWARRIASISSFGDADVYYVCSVCGINHFDNPPYFPNCGAKMKGGERG